jgi:hypothetical protein
VDWLSFLAGGTTVPAIVGLSAWLGRVWANRILEKDRARYRTQMESLLEDLRTRESKELFVHRLQFEKEFEIYKQLWTGVLALGRAAREFRDLKIGPVKLPEETQHPGFRQPPVLRARSLREDRSHIGSCVHNKPCTYRENAVGESERCL